MHEQAAGGSWLPGWRGPGRRLSVALAPALLLGVNRSPAQGWCGPRARAGRHLPRLRGRGKRRPRTGGLEGG